MKTNAHATIYNKYIDPTTRSEKYQRTVIVSVYWENRRAVNKLASGGDIKADKVLVLIPRSLGENFLSPVAWQELSSKVGKWTLQTGDVIVKGAVADEITTEFTISDLTRKYDDVLSIKSVDTMDVGSVRVQHWEVGAS